MKKMTMRLFLVLMLAGCGGAGEAVLSDGRGADAEQVADVQAETVRAPDLVPELPGDEEDIGLDLGFDVDAEVGDGPSCNAGEGCFLDPCASNDSCQSGWCVEHMGEGVCSQLCQEECPPGWTCKPVGSGGPDLAYACVSDVANLCKPCATTEGCKSPGGAQDVCVDYGEEGSFCGGACLSDEECPWGFSCGEATSVDGVTSKQCLADTGSCPCTGKSILLGLTTPCEIANEWGTCSGKRVCTDSGLTACDAAAPSIEICNGVDDNCDGDVDEALFVEGKYVNLCEDGNDCTDDLCKGEEGCQQVALTGSECKDGNPCTVADACQDGVCVGTAVDCDDGNPCTDDSCNDAGGCSYDDNTLPCDDGDPCTVADECSDGACGGFAVACDCLQDSDCAALEDGNLCNGTLFCSKEELPYQCEVTPESVVECPAPTGFDAPCLAAFCDPATGSCSFVPANDGGPCSDGDKCTVGDSCLEGVCLGGEAANCNDGNLCTDDFCEAETGCGHTPNALPCNDGDVCTTADECSEGACVGGPALVCDDGDFCNGMESCDPQTGCKAGKPLVCDDGDICNGEEGCAPELGCQAGQPLVCDDGNPCTDDSCDPDGGCVHTANGGECSDGNACTVGDHCSEGKCVHEGLAKCDDGNLCTNDSCDPVKGCLHLLNTVPCDDGDVCTTVDKCNLGECVGGGALACNDGNVCTADSCDPENGCVYTPNAAACDDGNACTSGDHCAGGSCKPGGMVDCDDGDVCTTDSCDIDAGCVHSFNTAPCDDGNLCTIGEKCAEGVCTGGTPLNCNDGDVCTDDACAPGEGCIHTLNSAPCSDGNACTGDDACSNGQCVPGPAVVCDDENVCTADSCNPVTGCVFSPVPGDCEDGNLCSENDTCVDGQCAAGTPVDCNDGNVCTDDSCKPDTGCFFVDNDVACNDGNACTEGDTCDGGQCQSGTPVDCNDANPCTTDSCEPADGCHNTPVANYTDCGGGKVCIDGECTACPDPQGEKTFSYTGGQQTWTVPECVSSVTLEAWGAQGGGSNGGEDGGKGGYAKGTLAVTPGQTLYIYVGEKGHNQSSGGWNGGGHGGTYGGGGGGGSDVRAGGTAWADRVLVGAGGAGGQTGGPDHGWGGAGGGLTGQTGGSNFGWTPGGGGTQTGGGSAGSQCSAGSFGTGGSNASYHVSGGGGGWYGGGCSYGAGGGGGSSYYGGCTNGSTQADVRTGHGQVKLTW